jgi:hypothetical protein
MGLSFSVVFESEVAPRRLGHDHVALGEVWERLDRIATDQELGTIGAYLSANPEELAAMFDGDPGDFPPLEWFDAAGAKKVVRAIREHLTENEDAIDDDEAAHPPEEGARAWSESSFNVDDVIEDLQGVEKELAAAAKKKVRFHFGLVD